MLHGVGLALPHPGPCLCAESAGQALVPPQIFLGTALKEECHLLAEAAA